MVRAMLLLSSHAFLRPGEMTKSVSAIKAKNVKSSSTKIKMTKFKHSKGRRVTVKVKALGTDYCFRQIYGAVWCHQRQFVLSPGWETSWLFLVHYSFSGSG